MIENNERTKREREVMKKGCKEMSNQYGVCVCYEDNIKDNQNE